MEALVRKVLEGKIDMPMQLHQFTTEQVQRLKSRIVQWSIARPLYPITKIDLFVTEECNLSCDYCFVAPKERRCMSWRVAKKAVDFLMARSEGAPHVYVTLEWAECS